MSSKRHLSVFILAMINVAAICNLKNFPLTAEYGLSAIFLYALAAIVFFIPVSLISAELATGWPETGGIYVWVKNALGTQMGMLAIFLQWGNNIIWYPSILSFTAATFAYLFNPALAENPLYISCSVLIIFWILTILNLKGMKISGWISTFGVIVGTIIPGILIMVLGILWIAGGNLSQTPLTLSAAFPNIFSMQDLALFSGILLTLAGMEMSAVHAKEVKNPETDYPKAILLSAIIIFFLSTFGGLAIAVVVPQQKINLAAGTIEALSLFLQSYNLSWALPVVVIAITIGALGMVSTWIVGPTKGLLGAGQDKELPRFFEKKNKHNMPYPLLIAQAVVVSLLSLVFLFMPSVSTSYWMLFNLTALLYLLMYILMFIAAIILRYKHPLVKRAYKIPFKNYGMWIVASLGIFGASIAFILGFFPPSQLATGNIFYYEAFLIGGVLFFCILPFLIYRYSKKTF